MNPDLTPPSEILRLGPSLRVADLAQISAHLTECIARKHTLLLDLSDVVNVDTLGLQLLISAQIACREQGGQLELRCMPATFEQACRSAGLSSTLLDPALHSREA